MRSAERGAEHRAERRHHRRSRRGMRETLWVARSLAGPAVWFALLCASLAIAPAAHEVRHRGALLGLHALAAVLAAAPGLSAYRDLRWTRRAGVGTLPAEHERFLTGSALALSALSVLLVIASAVPLILLAPGTEP